VADDEVRDLLRRSGISFVGTVQQLGASTMPDLAVDDHTAVVVVDYVLQSPPAFLGLAGSHVTVQLAEGGLPEVGAQYAFFANASAFGDTIAVSEVGRLSADAISPHLGETAAPTGEQTIAELQGSIESEALVGHANSAAAVVTAIVTGLQKAGPAAQSEHDPDWWIATLEIHHVESGDITAPSVNVAYANSLDVRWRTKLKPKAGQSGMWLLHASSDEVRDIAPYYFADAADFQPVQSLDALRAPGGAS
jgi:hypothetical protein